MTLTRRAVCGGLVGVSFAGFTGCSSVPDPTPVEVMLNADAGINLNENDEPSPIVVRVYELKGVKAFNNASYFDFIDDDAKTLGADFVASQEYELTPGQQKEYTREISSEATHLGVVAGFRNILSAKWRDSVQLEQGETNKFVVYVTGLQVRIQKVRSRTLGLF